MKKTIVTLVILIQFSIANCQTSQKDLPVLKGPYLGQKPPGNIPELFAAGIVSREGYFEHSAAIFSPDGYEVYWSGKPNGARYFEIYFLKLINGKWDEPKIAFSHEGNNFDNPVFSSDGKKLFFNKDSGIWFAERTTDGWTEPVWISSTINSSGSLRSITEDGSVYFSRYNANELNEASKHEIYVSRKTNGNYSQPQKLDKNINSDDSFEFSAYVAPDESYMVLEASKDKATCELFVSFRMNDKSWSERKKLPIQWGRFPSVSPDGKYLFYMTRDGIYWVSTKIIEEIRPK